MSERTTQVAPAAPALAARGLLQRKCSCGQHSAEGECEECCRKRLAELQRSGRGAAPAAAPPVVHQILGAGGQPLDGAVRSTFEPLFGHDFSRVRVHAGGRAAESARAVNAHAYTVGSHVVFGTGRYAPQTTAGRRLLAHELAHVVQQHDAAFSSRHVPLAGPEWEHEADTAADDVLAGRPARVTQRVTRVEVARETCATLPQPDGSEVIVERSVTKGQCRRRPRPQVSTRTGADASEAFFEVDLCRGRVSGRVRGALEYEDVITGAAQAFAQFLTDLPSNPNQAAENLRQALGQLAPEASIETSFNLGDIAVIRGRATGEASVGGGVGGEASVEALFEVLDREEIRIRIGPRITAEGGTGPQQESVQGLGVLEIEIGPRTETPECYVCRCSTPQVEYFCRRLPAAPEPESTPAAQPLFVPLFFEYADIVPRADWEQRYQEMLLLVTQRIRDGYTISRIEGAASPEGPLASRGPGLFEGNISLAQRRAAEAQQDLQNAIRGILPVLAAESAARQRLERALAASYPVEGRAELFGSTATEEVANRDLPAHLEETVQRPGEGETDPLAREHVIGEGVPESVRPGVESQAEAFRTGRQGEATLTESQRLNAIYQLLRRAVIVLDPPSAPQRPLQLGLTPEVLQRVMGTPIDCTEEHIRQCAAGSPVSENDLFEGDCRE